jgi:flagellar protein FliO/FliZ
MSDILGIELGLPARFLIAFVLVLALIGLSAWLIRQFGSARASTSSGSRNRQPRLAVLDSAVVDARRRLVLIRRDNVEHLILIGGPTDVVVEANVVRAQSAAAPNMQRAAPQRAPIEPIEPDYDPSLVPYDEPEYEEPPRQAPIRQIQQPASSRREPPPPPVPVRSAAATPSPRGAQARVEPQYDDMAHRLEAALRQPAPEITVAKPRVPATPASAMRPANEPRVMAPTPSAPAQTPAAAAKPAAAEPKSGADVFASLEEEMASLLKPDGKTPS